MAYYTTSSPSHALFSVCSGVENLMQTACKDASQIPKASTNDFPNPQSGQEFSIQRSNDSHIGVRTSRE
jgi:hypothetical protein